MSRQTWFFSLVSVKPGLRNLARDGTMTQPARGATKAGPKAAACRHVLRSARRPSGSASANTMQNGLPASGSRRGRIIPLCQPFKRRRGVVAPVTFCEIFPPESFADLDLDLDLDHVETGPLVPAPGRQWLVGCSRRCHFGDRDHPRRGSATSLPSDGTGAICDR